MSNAIAETKLGQSAIKVADSVSNVKTVVKEEALKRVSIVLDAVVKDPKAVTSTITTIFDNKVPTTRIASKATPDSVEVLPNKVPTAKPVTELVTDSTEVLPDNIATNDKLSNTSKSPTSVNSGYDPTKRTDIELQQDLEPSLRTGENFTQATKRVEAAQSEIMVRRPYDQLQEDKIRRLRPGETTIDMQRRVDAAETEILRRVPSIIKELGESPRNVDIVKEDAINQISGSYTIDRHGANIPLKRDPSSKTVEGRIYGDIGWGRAENSSFKWKSDSVMNQTVNDYLKQNWTQIKDDLAINGKHSGAFNANKAIGEGFFNPNQGTSGGVRASTYTQTSLVRITIKLNSDSPADFVVITTFPNGLGSLPH